MMTGFFPSVFLFFAFWINFSSVCLAGDYFPLVDGKHQAVIVGRSLFLRQAVEKCTGIRLKEIGENNYVPGKDDYPVYIGETGKAKQLLSQEISQLDSEGYIFLVQPDLVIIYAAAAKTDTGQPQLWAEANFCRDFFGVDQYFPGVLGEEYPKLEKIMIPCGKWVENPVFKHRHWSGYCGKGGPAWRVRASGGGGRFLFHHNLHRIIDPVKYANHPEYFPVIAEEQRSSNPVYRNLKPGERFVPAAGQTAYWQPCVSNPEVVALTVETICRFFEQNPGRESFSLGINDSGGFCQCQGCLKISPPGLPPSSRQANAYRMYKFYQQIAEKVAEKYPRVRLGFLAYSDLNTWYPEKLHPLLMPYFTQSLADAFDSDYREKNLSTIKRISSFATHFGLYEYLYGDGFFIPRIYLHYLAEGLRFAARCGADGFYAEAYPNWGLDGPKLYILEKLLWNPELDVDKLLQQWCQGLFGEAGPLMKEYFDFLEKAWCQQKPSSSSRGMYRLLGSRYKKEQLTEIFPPEVCEQAWRLLLKAEEEARKRNLPEVVKQRLAYFKNSFGATRLASQRFHSACQLKEMRQQEIQEKRNFPLEKWLSCLQEWARLPRLDSYMSQLRILSPGSFQVFCQEKVTGNNFSFAEWDSEPEVLWYLAERFLSEVTATRNFQKSSQLLTELVSRLESTSQQLAQQGLFCPESVSLLKPLLLSLSLDAARFSEEPVIDGEIESAWGKPSFSGHFFLYPYENVSAPEKTDIWLGIYQGNLYVAFYCYQESGSVLNNIAARDAVSLTEKKTVDGGPPFPYLTNVDAAGLILPDYVAIVTSAGGVFDARVTPFGYQPETWNGTTVKVKKTALGWCAEMKIQLPEKELPRLAGGMVTGYNFFRVVKDRRSAWVAASPNLWFISPRRTGIVFFP